MGLIKQLSDTSKQYGFLNAAYLVFTKIGEKFGYYQEVYTVFEQNLDAVKTTRPLTNGFYCSELSLADLNTMQSSWLSQEQVQAFRNRLSEPGCIGLGIYTQTGNELVYYFWISFNKIEFPAHLDAFHTLHLGPTEAYLYDGYCHPGYRGKGFHGFAAVYLMNKAFEAGKTKVITIIRSINRSAIVSQEKVGFRAKKEIRFKGFRSRITSTIKNL